MFFWLLWEILLIYLSEPLLHIRNQLFPKSLLGKIWFFFQAVFGYPFDVLFLQPHPLPNGQKIFFSPPLLASNECLPCWQCHDGRGTDCATFFACNDVLQGIRINSCLFLPYCRYTGK